MDLLTFESYFTLQNLINSLLSLQLELADLSSVRNFAAKFKQNFKTLSVLLNNAGLSLGENKRCTTKDGFEMVTGTNHLGAFQWAGL